VTFTATVLPTTATGSVEFKDDGVDIAGCSAVIISSGVATCSTSSLAVGEHTVVGAYSGDGNFLASTSAAITQDVFDQVITGTVPGSIIVPAGQSFLISGATIGGSVVASGARRLFICASIVHGSVAESGGTGFGFIGDAIPGDEVQSCGPNTIEGNVVLSNNRGGLELGGNHITGSAVIIGTAGSPPAWADSGMELEGNSIGGSLVCSANTPAPINDAHANAVRGIKSGQCSGL
jgi:hypothetical protein